MGNEMYSENSNHIYDDDVIRRVEKFVHYITSTYKSGYIADFGAGNGYIASRVEELTGTTVNKYDYYPLDKQTKKLDLNNGIIEGSQKYSLIYLSHVLEHIENVKVALEFVLSLLYKNGLVIIAVPDASFIDNKHKPFDTSIGHITPLLPHSLYEYLCEAGFTLDRMIRMSNDGFYEIFAIARKP